MISQAFIVGGVAGVMLLFMAVLGGVMLYTRGSD